MQKYIKEVEAALSEFRQGRMILLTDDESRENEADFVVPAQQVTPAIIAFMLQYGSGIICLALQEKQLQNLGVGYMVEPHSNHTKNKTAFMTSIEAKYNITTGVSAADRTQTILVASHEDACADDIVKPGHIFPLHAQEGGVLVRPGHTEGSVDLARLAGFGSSAVICEAMNPDGSMMKGAQIENFANQHNLKILSIQSLIDYRLNSENLIAEEVQTNIPLQDYGQLKMTVIKEKYSQKEHVILEKTSTHAAPLVRIHSACFTGDLLGSQRCDCHHQLHISLKRISQEGGVLIYLNQEGRGLGLFNKIKAYNLQDEGYDTVNANLHMGLAIDNRSYHLAATILKQRHFKTIRLLTNNPHKVSELYKFGIENITIENIHPHVNPYNEKYLKTKKTKLNHQLTFEELL